MSTDPQPRHRTAVMIGYRVWFVGEGSLPARDHIFRDEPLEVGDLTLYGTEHWQVEEIIAPDIDSDPPVVVLRRSRKTNS